MNSEHIEQVRFVSWFEKNYLPVRIFAIPNGGARHPAVAAKLKAEGVRKGVLDLFIPEWRVWIEMKTETGRMSKEQKDWKQYLESCGYHCFVCHGFEEAKSVIKNLLHKNNETITIKSCNK